VLLKVPASFWQMGAFFPRPEKTSFRPVESTSAIRRRVAVKLSPRLSAVARRASASISRQLRAFANRMASSFGVLMPVNSETCVAVLRSAASFTLLSINP
jgi:hypothetical protein